MFASLLVANRGEIACRIFRTARAMGVRCIAVHSEADARARHVREADEAILIGPPAAGQSYLDSAKILAAARASAAEAIHPGYGFLSENPDFAEAVIEAGFVWVGPTPDAIRAMGLKDEAKRIARRVGAPVVPGYDGADQSEAALKRAAAEIGYPVLIKAVAAGGGRGIREAGSDDDISAALDAARREAKAAFGDDRVLIEKLIARPRHIEVQVFGDKHANLVHLFERDCSLQRRRQKVIEEAPAPGMTEEARAAMTDAALKIARAVSYENAGTVEFIVSGAPRADNFYFMEMNTRLQVEHPVTEAITGVDLVAWQLRVAAGERLPLTQDAIALRGHAVEARVCAEDPAEDFRPSVGRFERLDLAGRSSDARLDSGFEAGDRVSPFYDSLIAKCITHDENDRISALTKLAAMLETATIEGLAANAGFLRRCLVHRELIDGGVDTGWIGAHMPALRAPDRQDERDAMIWAALALVADSGDPAHAFDVKDGWRMNAPARAIVRLRRGEAWTALSVARRDGCASVALDGQTYTIDAHFASGDEQGGRIEGRASRARVRRPREDLVIVHMSGDAFQFALFDDVDEAQAGAGDVVLAPLPGRIAIVHARPGARVKRGEVLAVLEAMKMEHALAAPRDGVVEELVVTAGAQVRQRDPIVRLKAEHAK